MSWSSHTVPIRRLDIRVRPRRDVILVANHRLETLELEEVAALLFRAVDGRRTIGDLARLLVAEFDIDLATAVDDVAELMADLAARALIEHADEA
jgi:Coenzyme PQQ synthesis protein D (PqqD)